METMADRHFALRGKDLDTVLAHFPESEDWRCVSSTINEKHESTSWKGLTHGMSMWVFIWNGEITRTEMST
jgi:hypothetical protein